MNDAADEPSKQISAESEFREISDEELERVKATVTDIAGGILKQDFEPTPSSEICSFCDYRIICPAAEK